MPKPVVILLLLVVAGAGIWWALSQRTQEEPPDEEALLAKLIENEDLLLDLTPQLIATARWIEQTSLEPSPALPAPLARLELVQGLASEAPAFAAGTPEKPAWVEVATWPAPEAPASGPQHPWGPLHQLGVTWETLKFGILKTRFERPDRFVMETSSEARGHDGDARPYGLKGAQTLGFHRTAEGWHLATWTQTRFLLLRAPRVLFDEISEMAIPGADTLADLRRSRHEEMILAFARTGVVPVPHPAYAPWTVAGSNHYFPGVSVVDYDGDGDDDVFLCARWGHTQLLQNDGAGTYRDVAHDVGLRIEHLVNCALFVDLDNDGDPDAILGRAMEPALYLRNDGGRFVDVTQTLSNLGPLFLVTGISASDVNRDGLLDVYLSTYPPLDARTSDRLDIFLTEEERVVAREMRGKDHPFLNSVGFPNVLLMNRGGGRLERVPHGTPLTQWRRSYQSVWADFDDDGDDDLYVCNDFAPDAFLRNDTPVGAAQPVFTDLTQSTIESVHLGFGMGASWGDYDADGDLDLYVSNMYSKAGKRIVKHLGTVDDRIRAAAAGNFLFENDDGSLRQRAGGAKGQLHVHKVGWSWGGQWADFDNDSRLDLYVPSGYYTAPKQLDTQVDN